MRESSKSQWVNPTLLSLSTNTAGRECTNKYLEFRRVQRDAALHHIRKRDRLLLRKALIQRAAFFRILLFEN